MRGTRGFAWYHVLFAVPIVAAGLGVQYLIRKKHPAPQEVETASVSKPSSYKEENTSKDTGESPVAKTEERRDQMHVVREKTREAEPAEPSSSTIHALSMLSRGREARGAKEAEKKPAEPISPSIPEPRAVERKHASVAETTSVKSVSSSGAQCASIEYRGDGPAATMISPKEWGQVVDLFLEVKKDLGTWLEKKQKGFPERTVAAMEKQLRSVRLQKPPVIEEPDLAWRGIGVWALDSTGAPTIRLGSGFVKLAVRQPARAKFELARWVAQSWAPCELKRHDDGEPWGPLLSCLQVNDTQACGNGSNSEAGWAVSSTLAFAIANPGCQLPAFSDPAMAKCLKKIPVPLLITEADETGFERSWKEAKR